MYQPILVLEDREVYPDNEELQAALDPVFAAYHQLNTARELFFRQLKKFQDSCEHQFEKIMERSLDIRKGKVYVGRKCKRCKLFEPKRPGNIWEICELCGGDMEHGHTI